MPGIGFNPRFRALNAAGTAPLAGGKLYSYAAGTSTPKALYSDAACTTAHDNPIILNSAGETTFYFAPGGRYKLTLKDSSDNTQTGWPIDYIDSSGLYLDDSADPYLLKWLDGTDTITLGSAFVAANRFSVPYAMGSGHVGYGMVLSNNSGDADHDIDFTAGYRADNTYTHHIVQASALTKKLDASWTVGTNQGMLRSGLTIATSTWYYIFAIYNPTSIIADYFADISTTPTLPTGYTHYTLLGAIRTNGSANIYKFYHVQGNKFIFDQPFADYSSAALTTTWVTVTLTVPPIADIVANISASVEGLNTDVTSRYLYVANMDSDPATGLHFGCSTYVTIAPCVQQINTGIVYPNSSGQIGVKSSGANTTVAIYTAGFEMKLGR